jgi:preprotein translocase subunit YajC
MFISPAFAQTDGASSALGSGLGTLMFPIIIFGIFYLLVFRPQQKKMKDHRTALEALRRGDQVVTAGGIVGKVTKVLEEGMVEIEIAEGVKVKVVKSTVGQVLNKTEPAAS